MKRTSPYTITATIRVVLFCLSLASVGCGDDVPVESPDEEKTEPAEEAPVVRSWYPRPKHLPQPAYQMPARQSAPQTMTTHPDTVYSTAPVQQQPQVIIVQPAWQGQYAQPVVPQQASPWQQQFPQYQYSPRPWGSPSAATAQTWQQQQQQPAGSGQQQTYVAPYGTPPAAGVVQPGWGAAPYGVYPGIVYPGISW